MRAQALVPPPRACCAFRGASLRLLTQAAGCYALCAIDHDVLYVGRTVSLRRRLLTHLGRIAAWRDPRLGYIIHAHYLVCSVESVRSTERGWMNTLLLAEGELPSLNQIYAA